jgi:hypothetical protein
MIRLRIVLGIVTGIVVLIGGLEAKTLTGHLAAKHKNMGTPLALEALNAPATAAVPNSGYRWKKTDLTYTFANCPSSLDCEKAREAVRQAFAAWDNATVLSFSETDEGGDIVITWGEGSVADLYPFDGLGGKVAQTAYPYQGGDWWFDGDIFFDDSEVWVAAKPTKPFPYQVHLPSVALHEIGHALGLAHSSTKISIMWPYYSGVRGLTRDAVSAVQKLYNAP